MIIFRTACRAAAFRDAMFKSYLIFKLVLCTSHPPFSPQELLHDLSEELRMEVEDDVREKA